MTKQETAKIITLLREFYPQGKDITEMTVNAWHELLKEYDFELMWNIAKEVAKDYEGYTMPPPAALIKKARSMDNNALEMWHEAVKAIRKGTVLTKEEFESLPKPVQMYFGDVMAIKELAIMEQDQIAYEKARFINNYSNLVERVKGVELIANNQVKELAERLEI